MVPPSGYIIRHVRDGELGLWPSGVGTWHLRDYFTIHESRDWNWCIFKIFLRLDSEASFAHGRLSKRYGDAWFQEFFLTWAVERVERGLRENEFRDVSNVVDVDAEDLRLVERVAVEKRCGYQVTEGRDLYCTADTSHDPRLGQWRAVGLKSFSPTSLHECLNCTLPDSRILCSQLSHPSLATGVGAKSRMVRAAKCGINRPEIQNGGGCHAGGHPCWERQVLPRAEDNPLEYLPQALTRALDFLDMAWRLRFPKAGRLVVAPSLESAASLERPCSTREEFNSRVISLADVLGALHVPDDLFAPEPESNKWRSLKRLEAVLKEHVLDDASRTRAIEGVGALRKANDLRIGSAHGGHAARTAAEIAARTLGIAFYPYETWARTWDQLRACMTDALSAISTALREPQEPRG